MAAQTAGSCDNSDGWLILNDHRCSSSLMLWISRRILLILWISRRILLILWISSRVLLISGWVLGVSNWKRLFYFIADD